MFMYKWVVLYKSECVLCTFSLSKTKASIGIHIPIYSMYLDAMNERWIASQNGINHILYLY